VSEEGRGRPPRLTIQMQKNTANALVSDDDEVSVHESCTQPPNVALREVENALTEATAALTVASRYIWMLS